MTAPTRADFRFLEPLRVRWAEVDMQKIVFNGHYLMYVDTAVAGYWRALALPYQATMEALQGDLYVRKATLEYEGSARYDDRCEVGIRCARIGTSSLVFSAAVFRGPQRLVHGELVYVFANPATQTSQPVPEPLRKVLTGFEAGETVLDVRVQTWAEAAADAAPLRRAVLMEEQGIDAALDGDAGDVTALHAVARNRLGVVVGTARLLLPDGIAGGSGQIGRVAVLQAVRGAGVGRALLRALEQAARERGMQAVRLDAQASAVVFFRKAGYAPAGNAFVEADIEHQPMGLVLAR
jgi:YbgC/YbaW family acyl-CoA thioester hydrolase